MASEISEITNDKLFRAFREMRVDFPRETL